MALVLVRRHKRGIAAFGAAAALASALLGCGDDGNPTGAGGSGGEPVACEGCDACPAGFALRPEGAGCSAIYSEQACPAGTRPQLGDLGCLPVGAGACAAGFEPDASGFGCRPIIASAICSGATKETLGQPSCQPIGDCAAPLPADVTHWVDDSFTAGEINATHFQTIAGAVAAAPAGSVIGVESGTYVESIDVTKPMTIVGRCAAEVIVSDPANGQPGIRSLGVSTVVVRGLTIRGHLVGVGTIDGTIEVDASVIEDTQSVGVLAGGPQGHVTLTGSVVRGTVPNAAGDPPWGAGAQQAGTLVIEDSALVSNEFANVVALRDGSSVSVVRSVLRDGRAVSSGSALGLYGMGAYAYEGGTLSIEQSALVDNTSSGLVVTKASETTGAAPTATLTASTVSGTKPNQVPESGRGRGIEVSRTGQLTMQSVTLSANLEAGIVTLEQGSVTATDVAIVGDVDDAGLNLGPGIITTDGGMIDLTRGALIRNREVGVAAQTGGTLLARESLITNTLPGLSGGASGGGGGILGFGVSVASGASVDLERSALIDNIGASLAAGGATTRATLIDTLVLGAKPTPDGRFGRGLEANGGALIQATRTAVLSHADVGVLAGLADSRIELTDSVVGDIALDGSGSFGHGAVAADGGRATITNTTIFGAAGVGLAVASASALLTSGVIADCTIGVHAQGGTVIQESVGTAVDNALVISEDTAIVDNGSRVGTGEIQIPTVIGQ